MEKETQNKNETKKNKNLKIALFLLAGAAITTTPIVFAVRCAKANTSEKDVVEKTDTEFINDEISKLNESYKTLNDLSVVSQSTFDTHKDQIVSALGITPGNQVTISNYAFKKLELDKQTLKVEVTFKRGETTKSVEVTLEGPTIVNLDFTTKTDGIETAKDLRKYFLNSTFDLTKHGYMFHFAQDSTANNVPELKFIFSKEEIQAIRTAQHIGTPTSFTADMTLDEFVNAMKEATGSALTTKPQFVISTEDEKKLGLTLTSSTDEAYAKTFFKDKFIGTFPNGIDYADSAKNKPFNPNAATNNMEVTFKDAQGNEQAVQFNMKEESKKSGESDDAYEARIAQLNSDSSTGSKFTNAINAGIDELKTYMAKLDKFIKTMMTKQDTRVGAEYIINKFGVYIVETLTDYVPILSTIKSLPIVGDKVNEKLLNFFQEKVVSKFTEAIINKAFPTT